MTDKATGRHEAKPSGLGDSLKHALDSAKGHAHVVGEKVRGEGAMSGLTAARARAADARVVRAGARGASARAGTLTVQETRHAGDKEREQVIVRRMAATQDANTGPEAVPEGE